MFGFGMPELMIILAITLIVAGPAKLPQLGQALGAGIRSFRKGASGDDTVQIGERKSWQSPLVSRDTLRSDAEDGTK